MSRKTKESKAVRKRKWYRIPATRWAGFILVLSGGLAGIGSMLFLMAFGEKVDSALGFSASVVLLCGMISIVFGIFLINRRQSKKAKG